MFKNIQVVHLPQLGPDILHGYLVPRITVYRIMYGQNVYVTMNADGSSAHYRTEEGDLSFRGVEEISCVGHHRSCRVVWGGVGMGGRWDWVRCQTLVVVVNPQAANSSLTLACTFRFRSTTSRGQETMVTMNSHKLLMSTTRRL